VKGTPRVALVSDTPAFVKEIKSDISEFAEVSCLVKLYIVRWILRHFLSAMKLGLVDLKKQLIGYVFLKILEIWVFILQLFSGTLF
jgi:hypothetical protein